MLEASALSFSYDHTPVLSGVDIQVERGEIVALLGASGCGKSTLLRVLAGLEALQGGTIRGGDSKDVAFVFQEASLMPWATVEKNVSLPTDLRNQQLFVPMGELLSEVGLSGYEMRYPSSLSGGQRMRVSIARALASNPQLMFLDEPFAALDEILRFQMNELLLRLRDQHALACVFVTHSIYEAAYLADKILIMQGGRIAGQCMPGLDRSLTALEQRNSAAFFKAVNTVESLLAAEEVG